MQGVPPAPAAVSPEATDKSQPARFYSPDNGCKQSLCPEEPMWEIRGGHRGRFQKQGPRPSTGEILASCPMAFTQLLTTHSFPQQASYVLVPGTLTQRQKRGWTHETHSREHGQRHRARGSHAADTGQQDTDVWLDALRVPTARALHTLPRK